MAPQKLSDLDKQMVLELYRQSEETTTTLASRFGVSNTTIGRILKQGLSEQEYEELVQRKRSGPRQIGNNLPIAETAEAEVSGVSEAAETVFIPAIANEPDAVPIALPATIEAVDLDAPADSELSSTPSSISALPRKRRRSTSTEPVLQDSKFVMPGADSDEAEAEPTVAPAAAIPAPAIQPPRIEFPIVKQKVIGALVPEAFAPESSPNFAENGKPEAAKADLLTAEEGFNDLDDDDLEDDLDDELDDDDDEAEGDLAAIQVQPKTFIRVLPLSEALIPKTCYLVVDRASELITRPLRDFAELGQIPTEEIQARTLPVFDNHRVARRFSRRMQRVVKVPDGKVLQKVSSYLQAKGITRLLIDGQVYSI